MHLERNLGTTLQLYNFIYLFIFKYKLGQFAPQIAEKLVEAGQDKYTFNSNKVPYKNNLDLKLKQTNKDKSLHLDVDKLSIRPIHGQLTIVICDQSSPKSTAQLHSQSNHFWPIFSLATHMKTYQMC